MVDDAGRRDPDAGESHESSSDREVAHSISPHERVPSRDAIAREDCDRDETMTDPSLTLTDPSLTKAISDSSSSSDGGRTVISRLEELLGFDPSIRLRNLTSEGAGAVDELSSDDKYVIERLIGEGGMGRVYLALDRDLKRSVAIKVIKGDLAKESDYLARFVEEAQITGQLEHPGIPPVHELAINPEGEVFFTLKLLRGRTLKEILQDLHAGVREVRERYSRTRLLQNFLGVCNAVHFAHEKGVLHRDIKPANIMIGEYGEVQLMDWGIAKVLSLEESRGFAEEPVETVRTDSQLMTAHGQIRGTLLYMSPEQAQGRDEFIDRCSDVYSLGATLYEILTLLPPKTGTTMRELLEESRLGLVVPPSVRASKQRIRPELEEICMKALEYHPDDRYRSALDLADALQVYLDGSLEAARRRQEAEEHLKAARKVLREHNVEKDHLQQLEGQLQVLDQTSGNYPSQKEKEQYFSLVQEIEAREISVAQKYIQVQTKLSSALAAEPDNSAARRALGELYLERFLRAEREKSKTDMIFYEGLIEQVNDGSFDRILKGNGSLSVTSEPTGAQFALFRFEESQRRLVPASELACEEGTLEIDDIDMGSYLIVIEREGYATTRYPVLVGRNQRIQDRVTIYPQAAVPRGFAYVPRGDFVVYDDPNVASTYKHRRRVSLPGFAIGVFPVTVGEYLQFLNDLHARDPDEARARSPRESENAGYLWTVEEGQYRLPPPGRYPWCEGIPIFGVSFDDARAYCAYRSRRDGLQYDLPSEVEWEKAAKGADSRHFSWGNLFENEFANVLFSRGGDEQVLEVDSYEEDCSPYGVRGIVGNVSEWCYRDQAERPDRVSVRGGNWALSNYACRIAVRRNTHDTYVSDRFGFRLKLVLSDEKANSAD